MVKRMNSEITNGSQPKIITFYLPQFHTIPENDYWWGNGFTEWTNVRKAVPLFDGHHQPNIPLNNYYYDLSNSNTQEWQSETALKYGIFGFCYYHYWFKDGKLLLEMPSEKMLKNKNITIPFCFSWANENWSRNWDGGNSEIMIHQDYGDKDDWEKHFQYLLPFFKDDRYITFNGKPVFIIYKPDQIIKIKPMLDYFRKRAREAGLPGLHIGFQFPGYENDLFFQDDLFDFKVAFEPVYNRYWSKSPKPVIRKSINLIRNLFGERGIEIYRMLRQKKSPSTDPTRKPELQLFDYKESCRSIIEQQWPENLYPGLFTGWDNTPRNKNGLIYMGSSPDSFGKFFKELYQRAISESKPIIFINAWNEWGEGAYLEPDTENRYKKLEQIKETVNEESESIL